MKKATIKDGLIPPQAPEIEQAVLCAILLDKEAIESVEEFFHAEMFYVDSHKTIAESIINIRNRSEHVDSLTLIQELKRTNKLDLVGGAYFVSLLSSKISSSAHVVTHCRLLMELFMKRSVIAAGHTMSMEAYKEETDVFDIIDVAERSVTSLTAKLFSEKIDAVSTLFNKAMKHNELLMSRKGVAGIPSGFRQLDSITGGWQNSDFIIIAARPGMGKTALVLSYARNAAAMFNEPVAIFSLEMSSMQLMSRLQSQESGIPLEYYTRKGLNAEELKINMNACTKLVNSPIYIDETPAISVFQLRNKARKLKREKGIKAIFIDYLQLMSGGGKFTNRESEVSHISRSLKSLAKELNIPIIALSQLSRQVEQRGGEKIPTLSDLRDSGAIEQDADMIQFIYRPEYYGIMEDNSGNSTQGKAAIIIAKHRNGSTDTVQLGWIGSQTKFHDLESEIYSPTIKVAPHPDNFLNDK